MYIHIYIYIHIMNVLHGIILPYSLLRTSKYRGVGLEMHGLTGPVGFSEAGRASSPRIYFGIYWVAVKERNLGLSDYKAETY